VLTTTALETPARHPVAVYLERLDSPESKRTMAGCLETLARVMAGDDATTALEQPWWLLQYEHTSALRARLLERNWAPATVNKHLAALRGVLRECQRLELMSADAYSRAVDIPIVKGSRAPAGRALEPDEIESLLYACQDDTTKGARDAAMIATLATTGIRRAELTMPDLEHWTAVERALKILGKGNKERIVYPPPDAMPYLRAWLLERGTKPGPLFCRVYKGGRVGLEGRMAVSSVNKMLGQRGMQAGIPHCTPHDMRRTFVGDLLDAGADLSVTSKAAGHASTDTTRGYDRRTLRAQRDATDRLTLPPPRRQPDSPAGSET
jgi:integrase